MGRSGFNVLKFSAPSVQRLGLEAAGRGLGHTISGGSFKPRCERGGAREVADRLMPGVWAQCPAHRTSLGESPGSAVTLQCGWRWGRVLTLTGSASDLWCSH